jgi:hypothetical protein
MLALLYCEFDSRYPEAMFWYVWCMQVFACDLSRTVQLEIAYCIVGDYFLL